MNLFLPSKMQSSPRKWDVVYGQKRQQKHSVGILRDRYDASTPTLTEPSNIWNKIQTTKFCTQQRCRNDINSLGWRRLVQTGAWWESLRGLYMRCYIDCHRVILRRHCAASCNTSSNYFRQRVNTSYITFSTHKSWQNKTRSMIMQRFPQGDAQHFYTQLINFR